MLFGAVLVVALVVQRTVGVDRHGATVSTLTIDSRAVGEQLPTTVVVPAAHSDALLVFLHGRGGDHSYWHDRADGRWGTYVAREVIPAVAKEFDANLRRVAIGGISMGGFGAYDIARLHLDRFCAVAGHSPALWRTGGETAAGAFDDAEDFASHDVIAAARRTPGCSAARACGSTPGTRIRSGPGTTR